MWLCYLLQQEYATMQYSGVVIVSYGADFVHVGQYPLDFSQECSEFTDLCSDAV